MIVIHHNKGCSKSRRALAILRAAGAEPVVIDYLKEGWTRPQLLALFAVAGLTPRDALRTSRGPAIDLGLTDPGVTDAEILDAMVDIPALVERPIVASPTGVRLCRPPELVLDLLEQRPAGPLTLEDGTRILNAEGEIVV